MTETFQKLQSINDGDFEELTIFFIRRCYPEFTGLKATGVNEKGRSIACPVDGIVHVPGNPPRCVALAATVTDVKDLKRKWLGGKNELGDIKKAAVKEFQKWTKEDPTLHCTLFLAINQLLGSDTDLYRESIALGKQLGVEAIIIEASELVDFLDNDPDGEYIREKILGIEANRISENLLKDIAKSSLLEHQYMFGKEGSNEIIRESHPILLDAIEKSSALLIGLRGASGVGKSTLLRQAGKSLNSQGNIAIWIPHNLIESSNSVEELLSKTLNRFHPNLNAHEGSKVFQIVSSIPCKLILLVDDINRSPNSLKLLQSLEFIAKNRKFDFIKFVVPLWPGQLSARPDENTKQQERQSSFIWEEIKVDVFSSAEKEKLIQELNPAFDEKATSLIDALHGDPFLCGIALESEEIFFDLNELNLIEEIFSQFLLEVGESARESAPSFSVNNFIEVIDKLVEVVVIGNEPEPTWEEIGIKLDGKKELLRCIASRNKIGWIDNDNGTDLWRWKHDKIRSILIGRWLANNVLINFDQENFIDQNKSQLSNTNSL